MHELDVVGCGCLRVYLVQNAYENMRINESYL